MRNRILICAGIVLALSATTEAQTSGSLPPGSINVTLPYAYVGVPIGGIGISGGCSISGTSTNSNPSVAILAPTTFTNLPTPVNPGPGYTGEFTINPLSVGTTQIVITYTINAASCPNPEEVSGGTLTYTVIVVPSGTTPPPTTTSAPLTTANFLNAGFVVDPVSTATGEIAGHDEAADLTLGGPTSLEFRRYYASYLSAGGVSSALGTNWMHSFDVSLAVSGTSATVTLFRGKTVAFSQSNNTFTLSSNEQMPYQLAAVTGGGYQFLDPRSNRIFTFSSSGTLGSIQDRNGNTITISQGANGPTLASDGLGRTLTFTYSGSNLANVQDQSGRTVTFQYSGGILSSWTDANGHQTTFAYTSSGGISGLMTSETRAAGNQPLTQTFDSSGRVSTQSDSFSNTTTLAYSAGSAGATVNATAGVGVTDASDSNMNLTSMQDSSGVASKFAYDSKNRSTSTTDRLGNQSIATWDAASGLPATYTDELDNTTSYTYAASTIGPFTFHDLAAVSFADGTSISLTRDSKGNVTSVTDQAGNKWQSTYTSNGWLATLTNPSGGVYTFRYNTDGTRASLQTPSSDTTSFGYDSVKRLNLITNPDSTTRTFQYDAVSNPLKATDERSHSASASFDANNNPQTLTDALAATASFTFDTDDRPTSTTDPLKNAVTLAWDTQSRVKSMTNAAGNSFVYTYDNLNRVTAIADASGNGFSYGLDEEARPTSVTDAISRTVSYTRDAHGNVVGMATPKNENFSFSFDTLNRPASTTDPLGRTAQYSRDPRGILSAVMLPGGVGASFELNALGLATSVTDPVDNVWNRAFDNMGRLTSKTDPLNRTSSFTYDTRQRLSTATFPVGTAQYSYDATGNLTVLKYSDGTSLSYTWDADNRLTAATGISLTYDADGRIANSNGLAITRDAAGRIASVTYEPNKAVTYTYNNRGLISQVTDWVGGTTTFTYDAAGELTTMAFANGINQTYTWDGDGRLLTLIASKEGTTLSSISLTRDALGRVISAARSSANIPSEARGVLPLAYDAASQIIGDTFDGLGRVTQDTQRSYAWDLASRLSSYTGSDGSASFTYDASGLRLSRTSSGVTQNYVWDYAFPLPVVSTVQSGGSDQTYYIWLPDGTLLNSISAADNTRRFYHFDESGSAVLLTDSTGTVTDTYAISIYGDTVTQTGSTANPFTWQGKFGVMSEGSTSLYYMRARYYDSGPARFLSRDPLSSTDPRDINPYQLVRANPVEHSDATGKGDDDIDFFEYIIEGFGFKRIHLTNPMEEQSAIQDEVEKRSIPAPPSLTDSVLTITQDSKPDDVFVPTEYAPDLGTPVEIIKLGPSCSTNMLFPFITNANGFETGIAISNTFKDPFAAAQPASCGLDVFHSAPPAGSSDDIYSKFARELVRQVKEHGFTKELLDFGNGLDAIGDTPGVGLSVSFPDAPATPYNPLKNSFITPSLQKAIEDAVEKANATAPPDEVL